MTSRQLKDKTFRRLKNHGFRFRELLGFNFPNDRYELKIGPNYFVENDKIISIDYDMRVGADEVYENYEDFFNEFVEDVIFNAADEYAGKRNKRKYPDYRRYLFAVELALSKRVSPECEKNKRMEIEDTLKKYPDIEPIEGEYFFKDKATIRKLVYNFLHKKYLRK